MNYNSLNELLAANTTNITQIEIPEGEIDDGCMEIASTSWLVFNGEKKPYLYVFGNSKIAFDYSESNWADGITMEYLEVLADDNILYELYKEEGTLLNTYKFLRIRWCGASYYNISERDLVYDVIFWDTGDISLHMLTLPEQPSNLGNGLQTLNNYYGYNVSADSPDVTFVKTDDGFEVNNTLISLHPPFEKRYLFRSGSNLYTVNNNIVSSLPSTVTLTANTFLTYGVKEITPEILTLVSDKQEVLIWWETAEYGTPSKIEVSGLSPLPQEVSVTLTASSSRDKYINSAEIIASEDAIFTLEYDGVLYYYNGTNWVITTSTSVGMSTATFNSLGTALDGKGGWFEYYNLLGGENKGSIVHAVLPTIDSYFRKIYYNTSSVNISI